MKQEKPDVFNTLSLYPTVGEELSGILYRRNLPASKANKLLKLKGPIEAVTAFKETELQAISDFLDAPEIAVYLAKFQSKYAEISDACQIIFRHRTQTWNQLAHLYDFMMPGDFRGRDKLDDVLQFLEIRDDEDVLRTATQRLVTYRINSIKTDKINVYAWLKKGEEVVKKQTTPPYDRQKLIEWLDNREWSGQLSQPEYLLRLPKIFLALGIRFVATDRLPNTLCGALRWFAGTPLIQIESPEKNLAEFWFTLFHFLGHVLNQERRNVFHNTMDLSVTSRKKSEREANAIAFQYLFNGFTLRPYILRHPQADSYPAFLKATADRFGVHEMFVDYCIKQRPS